MAWRQKISTTREINRIYLSDIHKKENYLLNKYGIWPFIDDWEELGRRKAEHYIPGFRMFHLLEWLEDHEILNIIKV